MEEANKESEMTLEQRCAMLRADVLFELPSCVFLWRTILPLLVEYKIFKDREAVEHAWECERNLWKDE